MSTGLYSGTSGLALGVGLYAGSPGLWGGAPGLITGDGASLYLNFLAGAPLDPRVTFSRGSNATLVDSTGKITYAPANLLLQSQTFETANWSKSDATVTADATTAPDGTSTADKLAETATTAQHYLFQSAGSAATHTASIYAKAAERSWLIVTVNSSNTFFNISSGTVGNVPGGFTAAITDAGNGWYRCSVTATLPASGPIVFSTSTANNVTSYAGTAGSGIFIWGAQLEPVTYQTTPGTYNATTTAAYYGPRFDYDPVTLAAKGLLIEEARTNLVTYSEQFNNGIWQKFDGTVTANTTVAPDGTSTADTLVENTANAAHFLAVVPSTSAGSHTLSVFYKIPSARKLALYHSNTNTGRQFDASGNQSAGLFVAPAGGATVTSFGNGWYRATITVTTTAAVQEFRLWMVRASDDAISYAGDGTSGIFIYGAQLEAGSFATSYIPTVASTVTRSADVATMTGTNFSSWYNQSEGTFVAAFDMAGGSAALSSNRAVLVARESATSSHNIYNGSGQVTGWTVVSGVDQAFLTTGALAADTATNMAYAYKTNDFAASRSGGTVATDTSGTLPAPTALGIGSNSANSLFLSGHIRQIAYYNTRLSNTQLQALTA